jgi:hypothetical protein
MVKHGVLQEKLIKSIGKFFPCQEGQISTEGIEFSIIIKPFTGNLCYFIIDKLKEIETLRLTCVILTTPKIQELLKKLSKEDMQATMEQFDKLYRYQFKTNYVFEKEYKSLQNMKYFFTQNLSYQYLLDSIFLNVLLVEETIKFLIIMDKGMESPKIDPNNSMYK